MLSMREIQNKIFDLIPTYREELRKLEERLITCGEIDHEFLSPSYMRGGMHIFGEAPADHEFGGKSYVPIDYIPCNHPIYIIRAEPEKGPIDKDDLYRVRGYETCPLCGKPLKVELSTPLDAKDLVLVCCPSLKEGVVVVDLLPIFSTTLVKGALSASLDIPHQRSKNPMTRVSRLM